MFARASRAAAAITTAVLFGAGLSACSDDPSMMEAESIVIGGFAASPLASRYAESNRDTLENLEGLAFPPISVHVRRNFAEDGRGVTSPQDDSAYIESVLRASTGRVVVNYVMDGERTSIDFETSDLVSFDSLFGQTTHEGHVYGVQIYTDLGTDEDPAPRDYVATTRWFTYEQRPDASPYDDTVFEFFGTYGARTPTESLAALGSASYEGNILGNIWDTGNPNRTTGRDLIRGSLSLDANLDVGAISGQVRDFRRFDPDADDPGWEALADTNTFEIDGTIMEGRFSADWEGRDSGDTPTEDSVQGFTGAMLGEFYGPAGEEIGGVLRGHRDATASTPEQIFNGFFSAGQ